MSLITAMGKTYRGARITGRKAAQIQEKRLKKLVRHARTYSPYYRALYAHLGEDLSLRDLPPTTKPEIMANFDDVLTDRNITMRRVEAFTENTDNIGRMIDGKYLIFKTSGSTGNPAVVLYDKFNIDVASAVAAFRTFARKEDYRAFMQHGKKTAGVFADYGFYLACGMSRYLQLKMPHRRNKITVDVNAPEAEIIRQLNKFRPSMLSGYPSNLALLADYDDLNIRPDIIITGGELLTEEIRRKLTERFGCYVQTHYSCTEAGEIACECSEKHLHINEDWIILEPVDRNDQPVGCDVQSDKVLITNLSNFVQPFIRYELTDRVIVHSEPCKCGRRSRWLEIEGRTDDILQFANGVQIAPMSLYKILEEVRPIRRFQLIQKAADRLELRMVSDDRETAFRQAAHDLTAFLESKGLSGITVTLSDELPAAQKTSGKFKHIYADF